MLANTAPLEMVAQASYDPVARLEMMDQQGIYAEIVYPNLLLFAMGHFVRCDDPDFATACIQMYNDASAEFMEAGKGRLFPMAPLPIWDVEACIKEAQRIKGMGFRGVVMPGQPQKGGLPDPADHSWDPLYEALSDLDLPINIHIGANVVSDIYDEMGKPQGPSIRWQRPLAEDGRAGFGGAQLFGDNEIFVINLVLSDLPLRFPKLRWVSVESGIGWIPHCLESIDFLYRMEYEAYPDGPPVALPNAHEMFKRSTYACFWFERSAPALLLEEIGVENVLWETDFPHSTALHPNPVERVAENLKGVPDEHVKRILQDNAAELYKIPV
jgi:predicted TIM-barrel fold metal-dependent hydrolase